MSKTALSLAAAIHLYGTNSTPGDLCEAIGQCNAMKAMYNAMKAMYKMVKHVW